jgi:hypothetical protein
VGERGQRRGRALGVVTGALTLMVAGAGCADERTTTVIRSADDIAVMTPADVAEARMPTPTTIVGVTTPQGPSEAGTPATPAQSGQVDTTDTDTIPLNEDDRPAELKLFDAFGQFTSCLADAGYEIEGNLQDPNNPAYQDPDYLSAVQTCAARSDIVAVLEEVQATRSSLSPEEVEERNENFVALRDCLEAKGWQIETTTDENGLISPSQFVDADGELDTRDIDSCVSELNIGIDD